MTNKMVKPNKRKKRRPYPPKHRKKLAEHCRKRKPWEQATGPKTAEGKAAIAQNAYKHGDRSATSVRLRKVLALQRAYVRTLLAQQAGTPAWVSTREGI